MSSNEWKEYYLSEIMDIIGGGTPKTSNPDYWDGPIPWISVTDFVGDKKFVTSTEKSITSKGLENSSTKLLHRGQLIISARGTVGELGVITSEMAFNQSCYGLNAKESTTNEFLYYLLKYNISNLKQNTHGAVFDTITRDTFDTVKVKLPPLPEQKRIADILGSLDDKIELNRRMNHTLESIARAIFKSWFVDFDPVRAKMEGRQPIGMDAETAALFPDHFEDSPLGPIPAGWSVKPIDEIANFLNGLALQKYPPENQEYLPVIKIAQMHKGSTEGADKASISIPKEYIVQDGDVLFSWSGSLEVLIWCGGKGALNQHLFKVTSKEYPKWFYFNLLLEFLPEFQEIAAGKATTMGHIQRHHLSNATSPIPSLALVNYVNLHFDVIQKKIIQNNLEINTLFSLREKLLVRLLTPGNLRGIQ